MRHRWGVRWRRPLEFHLIRRRPPIRAVSPVAIFRLQGTRALVETRGHVADLVSQHVLFHVALVIGQLVSEMYYHAIVMNEVFEFVCLKD